MINKQVFVLITLFSFLQTSEASEYMTGEELKILLTDKTFDGIYLPKNKTFSIYEGPDGTHKVLRPNGKTDKNRTWWVNDNGQHCTTNPKWKDPRWKNGRCSSVKNMGNGKYYKYNKKGEHTHTLMNAREGNQL